MREEEGLYFVKKETKDINEFLGRLLPGPAYIFFDQEAGTRIARSNDVQSAKELAADLSTLNVIRLNLQKIADAKEKAIKARPQGKTQPLVRVEVEKYLPGWVEPVVGERYEIG